MHINCPKFAFYIHLLAKSRVRKVTLSINLALKHEKSLFASLCQWSVVLLMHSISFLNDRTGAKVISTNLGTIL